MNCVNCGAALPAKSTLCKYCKTLNDVDLRAIQRSAVRGPMSDRPCPRCETTMFSIDLKVGEELYVERCDRCLGIFFDPGELETLIDASVNHVYEVDHKRLQTLAREEGRIEKVEYVQCPICHKLMNRTAYGVRSGVIVDRCRDHGVWVDGGELVRILKWAKAGGQLHTEAREAERNREEEHAEKVRQTTEALRARIPRSAYENRFSSSGSDVDLGGLLGLIWHILR